MMSFIQDLARATLSLRVGKDGDGLRILSSVVGCPCKGACSTRHICAIATNGMRQAHGCATLATGLGAAMQVH